MLAYDDGVLLGSTLKKWHQDNAYFRLTPSKIAVSSMAIWVYIYHTVGIVSIVCIREFG